VMRALSGSTHPCTGYPLPRLRQVFVAEVDVGESMNHGSLTSMFRDLGLVA